MKIAVLSSTNGTNLQSLIDAKKTGMMTAEIACLITNKPDCGAVAKAKIAGIPVHTIDATGKSREAFDREVMAVIDREKIDLVVLGGYMRIVGPEMVKRYKNRILNIHPSLLPKHAGGMDLNVHEEVIRSGEKETGMTIHYVDEHVDHGPIILQKKVAVDPSDTPETLKAKVQALEKEWYPKVVQELANKHD